MSDFFEKVTGKCDPKRQAWRIAYTLNNSQPVICSIISDQPLFYMDYEFADADEEVALMIESSDISAIGLQREVDALQSEIASYEKFSNAFVLPCELKSEIFVQDMRDATMSGSADAVNKDGFIERIIEVLNGSRMAQSYIDHAQEHGVRIVADVHVETAIYDRSHGRIAINPGMDFASAVLLAVRELRRHWQHRQGVLINPLVFHPDSAILINRSQIADLVVSMIRVAWELQLAGEKSVWECVENSTMADLARAFAREAFLDFRTLNNGTAGAAVFETWFLSERCRFEDRKLIQQMLSDYKGYVFDLEQCAQSVTPELISALGAMPYGKNYLAAHTKTIMNDPVFTEVRDRSNANFLWFIKFERSFRETEQELQKESGLAASGVHPRALHAKDQDLVHEPKQTAQIVAFDAPKAAGTSGIQGKSATGNGAEIIYLRRAATEN